MCASAGACLHCTALQRHDRLWSCAVQIEDLPTEMRAIPHSFKVDSPTKSLFLFADTEEERMTWRRRLREAIRAHKSLLAAGGDTHPADAGHADGHAHGATTWCCAVFFVTVWCLRWTASC
jgi:hypothetical protein